MTPVLPCAGTPPHIEYLLRLGDNALILGQRLAEWCGHGPVLEEDIALANIALDLIGQARLLLAHAAALEDRERDEDSLAYLRDAHEFRNFTMLELPSSGVAWAGAANPDYAVTIARNFLFGAYQCALWTRLAESADAGLAAIAAKSLKEARYHSTHAADWLVRFGDGTGESHRRAQQALDALWPYTNEWFAPDAIETAVSRQGIGVAGAALRDAWIAAVAPVLAEATLAMPGDSAFVSSGRTGSHSEHLSYLLAEMQALHRAHPGGSVVNGAEPIAAGADLVWRILASVPDPEIPVISICDLGIVREVSVNAASVRIVITPTYSGCPAMQAIEEDIRGRLAEAGYPQVEISTALAPAWTTDWMSAAARDRLREYGIAPPMHAAAHTSAPAIVRFVTRRHDGPACPLCGSRDTELLSQFASTACKALYRCVECREPFDYFKPI